MYFHLQLLYFSRLWLFQLLEIIEIITIISCTIDTVRLKAYLFIYLYWLIAWLINHFFLPVSILLRFSAEFRAELWCDRIAIIDAVWRHIVSDDADISMKVMLLPFEGCRTGASCRNLDVIRRKWGRHLDRLRVVTRLKHDSTLMALVGRTIPDVTPAIPIADTTPRRITWSALCGGCALPGQVTRTALGVQHASTRRPNPLPKASTVITRLQRWKRVNCSRVISRSMQMVATGECNGEQLLRQQLHVRLFHNRPDLDAIISYRKHYSCSHFTCSPTSQLFTVICCVRVGDAHTMLLCY